MIIVPFTDAPKTGIANPYIEPSLVFPNGANIKTKFLVSSGTSHILVKSQLVMLEKKSRLSRPAKSFDKVKVAWNGRVYMPEFMEIQLSIRGTNGTIEWNATVGLWDAPVSYCILGRRCGLEYFKCLIDFEAREVGFDANSSFPGRVITR